MLQEARVKLLRIIAVVVVSLVGTSLFADGLSKYKDWASSPQGYFMTKAEQQQWDAVRTDAEAQQFVDSFLARRGPDFAAEVASRGEQADKHLTIGKLAGSRTLRGKAIILFGPPSAMEVNDVAESPDIQRDSPAMAGVLTGGTNSGVSSGKGGSDSSPDNFGKTMVTAGRVTRNYHFTFASTPAGNVDVTIAADIGSGKDHPWSREDAKTLEKAFEAAARASIKTP